MYIRHPFNSNALLVSFLSPIGDLFVHNANMSSTTTTNTLLVDGHKNIYTIGCYWLYFH